MVDERLLEKTLSNVIKTGRYALGAKEALRSLKGSKLLIYANSIQEDARSKILQACQSFSVKAILYHGSSVRLGRLCGRPFRVSVIVIRSPGESDLSPLLTEA